MRADSSPSGWRLRELTDGNRDREGVADCCGRGLSLRGPRTQAVEGSVPELPYPPGEAASLRTRPACGRAPPAAAAVSVREFPYSAKSKS